MKKLTLIVLILAFTLVTQAQREEEVSGSYTYVLSENDGITLNWRVDNIRRNRL